MKAAPLIAALASICLLRGEANTPDIPIYPDFEVRKLVGTWYPIAVALENREMVQVTVVDNLLEVSDSGDIVLNMRTIRDGKCKVTGALLEQTDNPGIFNIPASNAIIRVVDVDYESYHIVHVEQLNTYRLYLLSRKKDVSADVRKKFKKLAKTLGFNQIVNEKIADSCPE